MKKLIGVMIIGLLLVGCSAKTETLVCKGNSTLIEGGTVELKLVAKDGKTESYESKEWYSYESLQVTNEDQADQVVEQFKLMFEVFNQSKEIAKVEKEDGGISLTLVLNNLNTEGSNEIQMIQQLMGDLTNISIENVKEVQEGIGATCEIK